MPPVEILLETATRDIPNSQVMGRSSGCVAKAGLAPCEVEEMIHRSTRELKLARLGSSEHEVTMLFADLAGFSPSASIVRLRR